MYTLDVTAADVGGPLAQFQAATADKSGTFRLLEALNQRGGDARLQDELLRQVFDLWWPRLEAVLSEIPQAQRPASHATPASSSIEDKLDRIIDLLERPGRLGGYATAGTPSGTVTRRERPRAFIGSSTEGLPMALAVQELLDSVAECTVWNQGVFSPGATYIESLQDARLVHDFAVIVATPDDEATKRGKTAAVPRDNLLFELGLFSGALGRARTFLVLPADGAPELPSDLSGVTVAKYRSRSDGNLLAALGPAVSQIRRAMGIASEAG